MGWSAGNARDALGCRFLEGQLDADAQTEFKFVTKNWSDDVRLKNIPRFFRYTEIIWRMMLQCWGLPVDLAGGYQQTSWRSALIGENTFFRCRYCWCLSTCNLLRQVQYKKEALQRILLREDQTVNPGGGMSNSCSSEMSTIWYDRTGIAKGLFSRLLSFKSS